MSTQNILLSLFFIIFATAAVTGQSAIRGTVTDSETGQPLGSVNIVLEKTYQGAVSDNSGEFLIKSVSPGHYTISASMMGYHIGKMKFSIHENEIKNIAIKITPKLLPGEEVVITSTRASKNMPVTLSNITKDHLQKNYIAQDVPVMLSQLPSVTFYSQNGNGLGYNYLNIRGFDQRRIAVMINGIPQNDPEDHNVYWVNFPDLLANTEDIQVQRGGGSAFYGTPAIGGSVNIITNQFSDRRKTVMEAAYGSYNTQKYSISYNSGIIDHQYSISGKLSKITSDGYRDNAWVNFNSYYLSLSRFDRNLTTSVNIYGGPISDGLAYNGLPKFFMKDKKNRKNNWSYFDANNETKTVSYYTERRKQEVENFSQPHYELINRWKISENATFHNTLFYVTGTGFFDYDGSWINYYGDDVVRQYFRLTPDNGFDSNSTFPSNTLIRAWVGNRQFGWLPRFEWTAGQHNLNVGGEFRHHRSLHHGKILWAENLPENFDPDYKFYRYRGGKDIVSFYAHDLWKIHPQWSVMADLQLVYNRYKIYAEKYVGYEFSVPYYFLNPRFGVQYRPADPWTVYTSFSYTSREPRLSNLYDAAGSSVPNEYASDFGSIPYPQFREKSPGVYDFSKPLIKPEKLFNIEAGAGFEIPNTLKLNATVFFMDFRDEIIKKGQVDRFGQPITTNADRTRHQGVEFWGDYRPVKYLEVFGNATWSRNRLIRFNGLARNDQDDFVPVSLNGNPIAGFPDVMGTAGCAVSWKNTRSQIHVRYTGPFYTDNFKNSDRRVEAHTVANWMTSVVFRDVMHVREIEMRLQINNLFNNLYFASGEKDEFFPGAERNFIMSFRLTF